MSLSESVLQSQIALNQNQIRMLHFWVDDAFSEMYQHIHHYKYYAGLKVEKEHIKKIKQGHYKVIDARKREIAKYVKLQKAWKDELKAVRQRKVLW